MKIFKQTLFYTSLIVISLFLFSCSKDDDNSSPDEGNTPPENIPLEVKGKINATVNGENVNYTNVRIQVYGLSNSVGIIGDQQIDDQRRDKVEITFPLEPTTGTFNHNEAEFYISYEAIMGNSEDGAAFNREATGKINVIEYKSIGTSEGKTYYWLKGTFERFGMHNFESETVTLENGEFDFVYSYGS